MSASPGSQMLSSWVLVQVPRDTGARGSQNWWRHRNGLQSRGRAPGEAQIQPNRTGPGSEKSIHFPVQVSEEQVTEAGMVVWATLWSLRTMWQRRGQTSRQAEVPPEVFERAILSLWDGNRTQRKWLWQLSCPRRRNRSWNTNTGSKWKN